MDTFSPQSKSTPYRVIKTYSSKRGEYDFATGVLGNESEARDVFASTVRYAATYPKLVAVELVDARENVLDTWNASREAVSA